VTRPTVRTAMLQHVRMNRWLEVLIGAWRTAGPELEALRDQSLRTGEVSVVMEQLADRVDSANHPQPLSADSGLVEMQRVFARLRP
jgi:hypothetical protein